MWTIFIYWAYIAYVKYDSEPISTEIKHVKMGAYSGPGIDFPMIAFCEGGHDFRSDTLMIRTFEKCVIEDKRVYFFEMMTNCLEFFMDIENITELIKKNYDLSDFLNGTQVNFWPSQISESLSDDEMEQTWTRIYHYKFGPCFSFHPGLLHSKKYKKNEIAKYINITFNKDIKWNETIVILHDEFNFIDEWVTLPWAFVKDFPHKETYIHFRKQVLSKPPTTHSPCVKYSRQMCNFKRMDNYLLGLKCQIPFFKIGHNFIRENISYCDKKLYFDAIQTWNNLNALDCPDQISCNYTNYFLEVEDISGQKFATVIYEYKQHIIEYHTSYISYDIQSLISEVGGTLGLTLGLSGLSIVDIMTKSMKKLKNRLYPK